MVLNFKGETAALSLQKWYSSGCKKKNNEIGSKKKKWIEDGSSQTWSFKIGSLSIFFNASILHEFN